MNNGRSLQYWKGEVMKDIEAAKGCNELQRYADWVLSEVQQFETVTTHLLNIAAKGDPEIFLSDANLYMELFGLVNVGWQWLKQATVAQKRLNKGDNTITDNAFYRSKIITMQYFFHYELVKTKALCARLMDEKIITAWKEDDLLI
jgi:Acetyl-CoA dehydrogenase C-terminal like